MTVEDFAAQHNYPVAAVQRYYDAYGSLPPDDAAFCQFCVDSGLFDPQSGSWTLPPPRQAGPLDGLLAWVQANPWWALGAGVLVWAATRKRR